MKQKGFDELGLSPEAYSAINKMGYKTPTKIQEKAIPLILAGNDVIGQSQTGTGKTMAFGLPAVDIVNVNQKAVQVLVLCPTRELALQAAGEIAKAAAFKHGLNVVPVFGGASIDTQIKAAEKRRPNRHRHAGKSHGPYAAQNIKAGRTETGSA